MLTLEQLHETCDLDENLFSELLYSDDSTKKRLWMYVDILSKEVWSQVVCINAGYIEDFGTFGTIDNAIAKYNEV